MDNHLATEQRTELYKFTMVLNPPPLDAAWRKRKRSRSAKSALYWVVLGAAGMLVVVFFAGWMA